jgi:hypothetical protein
MATLSLLAALLGAILGIRYTVFAVVPGLMCASTVVAIGWGIGEGPGPLFVIFLVLVACIQLGYLLGAAVRLALAGVRLPGYPKAPLKSATERSAADQAVR